MENYNTELYHHGIKGMRWGIRRYQNKDGSLTPAGQKHYNQEVAKLKKEESKFREEKKIASNSKKVREKFDKLEARKKALTDKKKALKESEKETDDKKKPEETVEERRARVLKSTNAKEIYKNKDILSSAEIQERLNRIDLEARLSSKIVEEHRKTALDYMDNATNAINKGTALLRSVDSAYSTVANSAIGKTIAKNLGIELPDNKKPRESLSSFLKNIDKKSDKEIQDRSQVESNIKKLRDEEKRRNKETEKEAQEKAAKEAKANKEAEAKAAKEAKKEAEAQNKKNKETVDESDGKVYGEGTSKSKIKQELDTAESKKSSSYSSKDYNERIRKAVDDLSKAAKKSTEAVNNATKVVDNYTNEVIKRNNDAINSAVNKSSSVKLSNADYKKYEKAIKEWHAKYDNDDSSYSNQQMFNALYEIENKFGISWRS